MSLQLLKSLAKNRIWLVGIGTAVASYRLQAVALKFGPLALVQPLIVSELLSAHLDHGERVVSREFPEPGEQGTAYTRPPDEVPDRASARYVPPGTRAELVVVRGPNAGSRYPLPTEKPTQLGRARDCDIVLDDVTVSRHHAEIYHGQGRFILTDTGSLNGTYLNRCPTTAATLTDGDELTIGIYRLVVVIHHGP